MVEAAPGKSADFDDLMDSHVGSTMELVMFNAVTDVVIFKPTSSTYLDEPTNCLSALRGNTGQGWYGIRGLPADLKEAIQKEDQMWLRVAEAAPRLITLKKKLIVVYVINGETGPSQLVSMMEVLRSPDVTWHFRQLRGMRLGIITHGVVYEHGDCDDLEGLYCHLVSLVGVAARRLSQIMPM